VQRSIKNRSISCGVFSVTSAFASSVCMFLSIIGVRNTVLAC